jgi:uncharacterized membrane protein YfcA
LIGIAPSWALVAAGLVALVLSRGDGDWLVAFFFLATTAAMVNAMLVMRRRNYGRDGMPRWQTALLATTCVAFPLGLAGIITSTTWVVAVAYLMLASRYLIVGTVLSREPRTVRQSAG